VKREPAVNKKAHKGEARSSPNCGKKEVGFAAGETHRGGRTPGEGGVGRVGGDRSSRLEKKKTTKLNWGKSVPTGEGRALNEGVTLEKARETREQHHDN